MRFSAVLGRIGCIQRRQESRCWCTQTPHKVQVFLVDVLLGASLLLGLRLARRLLLLFLLRLRLAILRAAAAATHKAGSRALPRT